MNHLHMRLHVKQPRRAADGRQVTVEVLVGVVGVMALTMTSAIAVVEVIVVTVGVAQRGVDTGAILQLTQRHTVSLRKQGRAPWRYVRQEQISR